jgi:uncharacterized protein
VKHVVPFLAGILFALGLGIAGMARPEKIIAFLDVTGAWDPSLMFVMAGALLVYLPFVQWRRRTRPALAQQLAPSHGPLDAPLIGGAVLFGIGWGLSGLCPGPSVVVLAGGQPTIYLFVACMFVGLALGSRCRPD